MGASEAVASRRRRCWVHPTPRNKRRFNGPNEKRGRGGGGDCRQRGPKTPRCCGPPTVVVLVTLLLVTPQDDSMSLQYLQASFHRLEQTNNSNRSNRQGQKSRSHGTHLLQNSKQFPATCSLQNSGGYNIKSPCNDIKSNPLLVGI